MGKETVNLKSTTYNFGPSHFSFLYLSLPPYVTETALDMERIH